MAKLTSGAMALGSIGDKSRQVVEEEFEGADSGLFSRYEDRELNQLSHAFQDSQWKDAEAAVVLRHWFAGLSTGERAFDIEDLRNWIALNAKDDEPALAVIDCMDVVPPSDVTVLQRLSRRGSQKIVFLASWRAQQRQVVLKQPITESPTVLKELVKREAQSHPLSHPYAHPNIIKTYSATNPAGAPFFIEEYLTEVLSDSWPYRGREEVLTLLRDMSAALQYLHDDLKWVHGDVKPDNIGRKDMHYVLLDFGICKHADEFDPAMTGTGSLRTRAPELFTGDSVQDPTKLDIWALGATVFRFLKGRFPFFGEGEVVPRVSVPVERSEKEEEIRERIDSDWKQWVDLSDVNDGLRGILDACLQRNPADRVDARELMGKLRTDYAPYVREPSPSPTARFSKSEELQQLKKHLGSREEVFSSALMPEASRQALRETLRRLSEYQWPDDERRWIESTEVRLAASLMG